MINDHISTLCFMHPDISLYVTASQKGGIEWRAIECKCKGEYSPGSYKQHLSTRDAFGPTAELAIAACLLKEWTDSIFDFQN